MLIQAQPPNLLLAHTLTVTLGVALLVCVALVVLLVVRIRHYRRWLGQVGDNARQLAKGDFSRPIKVTGPPPVVELAQTLNQMALQLDDRLSEVVRQRNELGTILSSMDEGVVAVDSELRVISLNKSAAALLQLDPAFTIDRPIDETVTDRELRRYISQPLETGKGVQGEITLARMASASASASWSSPLVSDEDRDEEDASDSGGSVEQVELRTIEATSAILRDAAGRRMGVVLVLHDVTELRRLELIRQDFVANVSHELRTPISAIKAAAETLFDDMAYEPQSPPDPELLRNFLGIIARQADRLHAIVEDLLSLARIEQGKHDDSIELITEPLSPVIAAAVETCQGKADQKDISIRVQCEFGLMASMERMMLEQALINLIDNAVKYSPDASKVEVHAIQTRSEVKVTVLDEGRGIEPEHLPRLFERFYRTDKARSRNMGGTGLGLSIVKHIAEAHGGRVSVESRPGAGSTFILTLPLPD